MGERAKSKRGGGKGLGRIRIKGRWTSWAEIKQEGETERVKRKELSEGREGREKEGEQNFAI